MTFDYVGYDLEFIQQQRCKDESAHLFTRIYKFYSPVTRLIYIVRAEYHEHNVFAIKFYAKKDKRSDYKYSHIVNKGDIGNIFMTCAKVVPLLLHDFPTASFAFAGARSIDELSLVEGHINNQRYRIYKEIIPKKFGQQTFLHFRYDAVSSYLLVNRLVFSPEYHERDIVAMFQENYITLADV